MTASTAMVLLATLIVSGCAGAPPAGTPEHDAWVQRKQEDAAAIERGGRLGGSLDAFPIQSSR